MSRRSNLFWIVPSLTFLVGLLLGGVFVGVSDLGRDQDDPVAVATPTPTPVPGPPDGDLTVTVPQSCVEAAERAGEIVELTRDAAEAVAAFDVRRLQQLVGQMRELQEGVSAMAGTCRQATADDATS